MNQLSEYSIRTLLPPEMTASEAVVCGHFEKLFQVGFNIDGVVRYPHLAASNNFLEATLAQRNAEQFFENMMYVFRATRQAGLNWTDKTLVCFTTDNVLPGGRSEQLEVVVETVVELDYKWVVLMLPNDSLQ